jgi:nucleotide-binding universal stress UspA family protein
VGTYNSVIACLVARPGAHTLNLKEDLVINKILVPLDGSQDAETILPYVERLATAMNARVLLLAAVDRPRDWGEDTGGDLKGERHEAESYLRRLQARLASATGNDVEAEVVASEPAAAVLAASEKQQPDLIAMTTHGRSGVARWVLGSVAAKLLHATHTPMLVVRPPTDGKQSDAPTLTKILVPLDGSELSASVLPFAADLAKSLGASVMLFHAVLEPVMTYPAGGAVFDSGALKGMEAGAHEYLAAVARDLDDKGVKTNREVAIGNATDGIVWAAEREGAELIVMSTHGRSGIGRIVLGSIADAVVRRTSLPVILVRPTMDMDKEVGS